MSFPPDIRDWSLINGGKLMRPVAEILFVSRVFPFVKDLLETNEPVYK